MLPTALLAQPANENMSRPDPIIQSATLVNNPHVPVTLTLALRTKLHPTLLKQLLTAADDQLPVQIQLRAQPNLDQPAITSAAATAADRRTALVSELQTTASHSQAQVLAILDGAQQARSGE